MKAVFFPFLAAAALFSFPLHGEEILLLDKQTQCPLFRSPAGEWSNADSRVTLIREDDALILEAICRKPEGTVFSGQESAPDAPGIFACDVFELLVSPRAGVYYHLALSPAGGFYTAKGRDTRWGEQENVTAESCVTGDEWKIRFLLPYAAMETEKPEAGCSWKICIGQILPAEYGWHEASSLTGAKDFHNTGEYARLIIGGAGENAPRLIRVVPEFSGCRFRFSVPDGWSGKVDAKWGGTWESVPPTVRKENGEVICFLPYPDAASPLKMFLPVTLQAGECTLSGKVRIADPAQLELDRFYLTPEERSVSFSHRFTQKVFFVKQIDGKTIWEEHTEPLTKAIALRVTDEMGRTVCEEHCSGRTGTITLPEDAAPGAYRIIFLGSFGMVCREVFLLPETVPVPKGDLVIRQGKLYKGEKPLFLVGTSQTEKTFLSAPAFSLDLGKQGAKENAAALLMLPSVPYLRAEQQMDYPALREHLDRAMEQIQKEDPGAKAMVRLACEANQPLRENGRSVSPVDFMKRFYSGLKARAGKRLITIQCDDRAQIAALSEACDLFECAFYSSSYAPWMMEQIRQDMAHLKKSAAPGKPLLFWLGGTVPNKTCRLAEEIRCASALAVIYGFQGVIIHLGHGSLPPERKRIWSLLSHLDDEMQGIYARLSEGEDVTARYPLPAPLIHRAVRKGKKVTFLIVNPTGTIQRSFGFLAPYGIRVVEMGPDLLKKWPRVVY